MKRRSIKVEYLARVEGEGSVNVTIRGDKVQDVQFGIFEPPRFFEAFLKKRHFTEAPDITARICGICPVAYQMSSVQAMEQICGVTVDGQLRDLRRLLYCGEWIESHALHVFMLHAPDFLGYEDAVLMAKDYPEVVANALKVKKVGNDLMTLLGGREIHPINVKVGGFYHLPHPREFAPLAERMKEAMAITEGAIKLISGFEFPAFEREYTFVALRHPKEYAIHEGRLVSSAGLDIDISEYENHFQEEHVEHANALQSVMKDGTAYFVGPLARYNLNYAQLSPRAKAAAKAAGLGEKVNNPFKSILVRGVELFYALEEAIRLIEAYNPADKASVPVAPKAGVGYGCTEAPRGICWHKYRINDQGLIEEAKIVPPTSQNQRTIEHDLRQFVTENLKLSDEDLTWKCEQAVRNYDPCISCATHAIKVRLNRVT